LKLASVSACAEIRSDLGIIGCDIHHLFNLYALHADYVRSLGNSGLRKLTVLDEVPSIIEFAMLLENSDGIIVSAEPVRI
jgi:hypothetical protein